MSKNEAAAKAMELAKNKAELCIASSTTDVTANKQFKASPTPPPVLSSSTAAGTSSTTNNIDDNDDIVYTIRNIRSAASTSNTATSDLKSLDDALKDAVKYVKKINETSKSGSSGAEGGADVLLPKSDIYLSEHRIFTLIKQCKNAANSIEAMEVDNASCEFFCFLI